MIFLRKKLVINKNKISYKVNLCIPINIEKSQLILYQEDLIDKKALNIMLSEMKIDNKKKKKMKKIKMQKTIKNKRRIFK